jgi:hypothetical protein
MAKKAGLGHDLHIGGIKIGNDVSQVVVTGPRTTMETTGIDKSGRERLMLGADGTLTANCYFNDATDQIHDALKALPTTDVNALWALGSSIGDPALMIVGKQVNYDWTEGADRSLNGAVEVQTNGVAPEWGELLTAGHRTDTSATNGSSLDNSASSANGGAAMIHCSSFSGTNVTVDVEDSTDDSSFANFIVFTAISAKNKTERKTASGTVNRYLRVVSNGTFSDAKFTVGFRRGTTTEDEAY